MAEVNVNIKNGVLWLLSWMCQGRSGYPAPSTAAGEVWVVKATYWELAHLEPDMKGLQT